MPEALLVTPIMPALGGNGIAMRAGNHLEGLARAFRVRCLVVPVFGPPRSPDSLVRRLATTVTVLPLDRSPDAVADLKARLAVPSLRERAAALHPRPRLCRTATLAAATAVAGAADGVALVHVYRLYLAPFLDVLLDRPSRPVVTIDADELDEGTRREAGDDAEAEAYRRLADHYLPAADHVVVTSPADAATLSRRYGRTKVTTIANAVRPPMPIPAPPGPAAAHDLLFVGTLSYPPNAAGVRWLCEQVLPHLPEASLAVVGSNPPADITALADAGRVTVAAAVPDVTPWYAASRLAVAPLHAGGGTRIKVVEALAHNRPVLATATAAQGLDFLPGRDGLVVADDAQAFADACRRLLAAPDEAARLAARGREAVLASATVDVVAAQIDELSRSLVSTRTRAVELASRLRRNQLAADLCARLAGEGVTAILLKGPSFGTWLYDSPLDRPARDIDLLIDPAAEPAASAVLSGLGFEPLYGRSGAMLAGRPAAVWTRGPDLVDLHRGWFRGIGVAPRVSWAVLSAHTEHVALAGREVAVLDAPARTLHVALHAVVSGLRARQPREDLERAIERVPVGTWCEAAEVAAALQARATFAAALDLTAEGRALALRLGLGRPGPPSIAGALIVEGAPPLAAGLARLAAVPGLRAKLAVAARAVVPTPSYLATQQPWASRNLAHTALAYPVWLVMLARRAKPAVAAVSRARRAAREPRA